MFGATRICRWPRFLRRFITHPSHCAFCSIGGRASRLHPAHGLGDIDAVPIFCFDCDNKRKNGENVRE